MNNDDDEAKWLEEVERQRRAGGTYIGQAEKDLEKEKRREERREKLFR